MPEVLKQPSLMPALAPAPWFPEIDGNELVVVDTNVAQAVDQLRGRRASHAAQAAWIRRQAKLIDFRRFWCGVPRVCPFGKRRRA